MRYVFQFGIVADHLHELAEGAAATLRLSAIGGALGLLIAILCVLLGLVGSRPVRRAVQCYVEAIRNTPFLVQLFVIYFSLPATGLRLEENQAAIVGLALNFGGYATEILRAGVEAVPHGQIEAGRSLGLTRVQIFRLIVLRPALRIVYPALAGQFVMLLLGSSVLATISVTELTGVTNSLQSQTFRSFEFYFVATAMYLVMALAMRALLAGGFWLIFSRGRPAA